MFLVVRLEPKARGLGGGTGSARDSGKEFLWHSASGQVPPGSLLPFRNGSSPCHGTFRARGRARARGRLEADHHKPRSRVRYWTASPRWLAVIWSEPAKSAMVRATFKIRS